LSLFSELKRRNAFRLGIAYMVGAIARRDTSLFLIVGDPFMNNIRNDPRFDVVLKRPGRTPP
jgi:hypothetical protein